MIVYGMAGMAALGGIGFFIWSNRIRVELSGGRARVWLGDEEVPLVDTGGAASPAGAVGLRVVGGGMELHGLTVRSGGGSRVLGPDDPGSPETRALQWLCLTILNLNEMVYVD